MISHEDIQAISRALNVLASAIAAISVSQEPEPEESEQPVSRSVEKPGRAGRRPWRQGGPLAVANRILAFMESKAPTTSFSIKMIRKGVGAPPDEREYINNILCSMVKRGLAAKNPSKTRGSYCLPPAAVRSPAKQEAPEVPLSPMALQMLDHVRQHGGPGARCSKETLAKACGTQRYDAGFQQDYEQLLTRGFMRKLGKRALLEVTELGTRALHPSRHYSNGKSTVATRTLFGLSDIRL